MSPLRILLLEDNTYDAELIQELLEEAHRVCQVVRVQSRAEFLTALKTVEIELILADYKLPSFDGLSALKLALTVRPELPFIFVSGTLGEEVAIEALKIGATDYVLKTRLSRLVPSVERALREAQERAERKKAEEALRRSEMYLAEAQRLSNTGSFGWNVTSGEIYWSEETYRIFACDPAIKPTLQMVIDLTHPDDRTRLRKILDRASIERRAFTAEHRLVLTDGSVKYVRAVAHGFAGENPDSFLFVGAVTDITERKCTEETLREQASLLNLTHDAIFVCDMNGVITYWNRGAEALYGWSTEDAKGELAPELLKTILPVPFERITAELRNADHWEGELVRTRKDGTQVPVESRWSLQRNARGVPVAALESSNDITHRKRAETERERLRLLETDLAHINRVSMMGELTASLAHEIKQPMAAAVTSAGACMQWLRRDAPDITEACDAASGMLAAVMRASSIIDGIDSLYRRSTPERELLDLNDIVREMTVLLRDTADRKSISIRTELDMGLPRTTAHRVQLQQVLMNLMLNGIEAMQDTGGELIIGSKRTEHDQLLISVSDSGTGLPTNEPERIFEAFFTTKQNGTGMGLSISRRIIESHGGRLYANPKTERGATFQFTLPGEEMRPERVVPL
ncbi:PAS domain S-box protein [Paraburkholderia fungorum]|uniref:hybrid sensor histidine kinase/response regulator n=1 Tax=Paraburkholderia fungorum TaxID=134537 RepID=UPI0038BE05A3